ncbi:MAG: amino acid permease [Roseovarius sp.]
MSEALKRRIGLPLLTAYGVGVMVGAGIYVLVGAVASQAGAWAPLSFILAGLIAAPTALSYAEFSTRLPEAAGEAAYVAHGLRMDWLGVLVGVAIVLAGTISAAAVLRGGAGYLALATGLPQELLAVVLGLGLVAVALAGVLESLALAAIFTGIEILGLVLVMHAGWLAEPVVTVAELPPIAFPGLAAGAVLAFFAFIGFEDIVNMAEEVEDPERVMPRAILIALLITSLLYALVAVAAVRAVPLADLAQSEQPLALVWQAGHGGSAAFLALIAVAAAMNGVLAQIVMAARVLFGLGRRTPAFAIFHHAHERLGTPVLATCLVGAMLLPAALTLPVAELASATSALLLGVFVLVNAALLAVKRGAPPARFNVPAAVPAFGLLGSLGALYITLGGPF